MSISTRSHRWGKYFPSLLYSHFFSDQMRICPVVNHFCICDREYVPSKRADKKLSARIFWS